MGDKIEVTNITDINDKRKEKEKEQYNDAIIKGMENYLNVDSNELMNTVSNLLGDEFDKSDLADSFKDAIERNNMYKSWMKQKEKEDEKNGYDPQQCFCSVCPSHVGSEFQEDVDDYDENGKYMGSFVKYYGRQEYCGDGVAQDCLFRMKEPPVSNLHYSQDPPSYQEALHILSRNGLLEPDELGKHDGTDFAFHQSTRNLWFSFCELIGEIVGYNWNEPIEKSGSIQMAKHYFKERMGYLNSNEWKAVEKDILNQLRYFATVSGNDPDNDEGIKDSIEYSHNYIMNILNGITMGNIVKQDEEKE